MTSWFIGRRSATEPCWPGVFSFKHIVLLALGFPDRSEQHLLWLRVGAEGLGAVCRPQQVQVLKG